MRIGDPCRPKLVRRRQRPVGRVTTIVLVTSLLLPMLMPASVLAARNCDSNVGNFFAGWAGNEGAFKIEGVSASLTYRTSSICTFGGGNFDTGWTMLAATQFQYVQSGFFFDGSAFACMRHFAQQSNGPNLYATVLGSCTNDGEVHRAWQQYLPNTGGHIRSNIDTTVFMESSWNVLNWPHPWSAQFYGEVGNMQGDIPGRSTRKTDWSSMTVQAFTDNVYRDTCGRITLIQAVDNARWAADAPSCNHVRAWTETP